MKQKPTKGPSIKDGMDDADDFDLTVATPEQAARIRLDQKCFGSGGKASQTDMPIPSTRTLAMLAAMMGKGPEDALKLWLESERIKREFDAMPQAKRDAVCLSIGKWIDPVFNLPRDEDFQASLWAEPFYTLEEAMKYLNIQTKNTFFELMRFHLNKRRATTSDNATSRKNRLSWIDWNIKSYDEGAPIDGRTLKQLEISKRAKRSEIAKANKARAGKKRKERKPVK